LAYILCIETATPTCSVAISRDDTLIAEEHISEGLRHSAALTTIIDKVLSEANLSSSMLSAVAISDGPGSYTGLRVGASTAKAICYAHDIPLIAISTLESIASSSPSTPGYVMATIDARRMEVYAAIYDGDTMIEPVQSVIWADDYVSDLVKRFPELSIVGTGVQKGEDHFRKCGVSRYDEIECRASFLAKSAYKGFVEKKYADLAYHVPNYFKMPNITTPKQKF